MAFLAEEWVKLFNELLEQFKLGNTHAALVIDEFGATVGNTA